MPLNIPIGKQKEAILESDAWINIADGAVRSGKTVAFMIRWLDYITNDAPQGEFVITGKTRDTVKRNVLDPLITWFPNSGIIIKQNECVIFGRRHYIIGGNDERAEVKLRGLTLAGALCDEVSTYPESFFAMLISRLSVENAKCFCSTNPENPQHWLKVNYLDRPELDLKNFHFSIDDNPNLGEKYVTNLKKTYTGLWYKRFIQGLWVAATGSIYDMFDEKIHVLSTTVNYDKFYTSCDYGTNNPCVFLLFGITKDKQVHCIKEYYYDGRKSQRQKTDGEYSQDLKKFIEGYKVSEVLVDPSALSFITQLRKDGFVVRQAKNDVLDGIRTVSNFLTNKKLFIHKDCTNTIKEFYGYVWDETRQEKGEDAPKKESDHCMDALRYLIFTIYGKGEATAIKRFL